MKAIKIPLEQPDKYTQDLCSLFAEAVYETNMDAYSRRNQDDKEKVISDIRYGKIAEMMVHRMLMHGRRKPNPVDFHVYGVNQKSYDCDISIPSSMIHVKSCLDSSAFPNSWLFQPNDPVVKKPSSSDILALVILSKESYCYMVGAQQAYYKDPVKKSLNKKVIYEDDVVVTQK